MRSRCRHSLSLALERYNQPRISQSSCPVFESHPNYICSVGASSGITMVLLHATHQHPDVSARRIHRPPCSEIRDPIAYLGRRRSHVRVICQWRLQAKKGYDKLRMTCVLAAAEGLTYAWADTCCIDKRSSAELTEAINSMFVWYQKSVACYTYLSDLSRDASVNEDLKKCRW